MSPWILLLASIGWVIACAIQRDPRATSCGVDLNRKIGILVKGPWWFRIITNVGWLPLMVVSEVLLWQESVSAGLIGIGLIVAGYLFVFPWFAKLRLLENEHYQRLALSLDIQDQIYYRKEACKVMVNMNSYADTLLQESPRAVAIAAANSYQQKLCLIPTQIEYIADEHWSARNTDRTADFCMALAELAYKNGARTIRKGMGPLSE